MGAVVDQVGGALEVTSRFTAPPVVQDFIECTSFVSGFFGPFGCSKTTSGCIKSWGYGCAFPGARIAVIRDTWPNLRDTTMKTFFEWFPNGVMGHYEASTKTFWLNPVRAGDPPTEIVFRAMYDAADMSNVLSLDLAAAHLDEPQGGISYRGEQGIVHEPGLNRSLFDGILGRIGRQSGYPPMLWMTGNPPDPTHWIPKVFKYNPGKTRHDPPTNPDPDFTLFLGDQDTNRGALRPGYYESLTRLFGYGSPMEMRFVRGLWIAFAQTKPFHPEWIQHAGMEGVPSVPYENLFVEAGYDPAISKKDEASSTAIVIGGQDMKKDSPSYGLGFIVGAKQGHWSPSEALDELVRLTRHYGIKRVRVEKVAFQEVLQFTMDKAFREAGLSVSVELVAPDADKLIRANAWSNQVQEGRVIFGPGTEELVTALCAVPQDKSAWDLTDAAGYLVRGFRKIQAPSDRVMEDPLASPGPAFTYAGGSMARGSVFAGPGYGRSLRASTLRPAPGSTRRGAGYATRGPRPGDYRPRNA